MKLKNEVRLWLDMRKPRVKTGDCPIKMVVNARVIMRISTGMYCLPEEWDGAMPVQKHRQNKLRKMLVDVEDMIYHIEGTISDKELKNKIECLIGTKEEVTYQLSDRIMQYAELARAKSTRDLYSLTAKVVGEYDKDATYTSVDRRWLEAFDRWMDVTKGMKMNTRSVHMRNLRAVYNWGLDNEYTSNYPFRKFVIRQEETKKRNLSVEELRALIAYKPTIKGHEYYRDIFMLLFYLIGINISDLMDLKHEDLINGRIEYRRKKTGKLYSIKVEPEAQKIIDRYKGKEYLLNVKEKHPYFGTFINQQLKSMGEVKEVGQGGRHELVTPLLPSDVSTYWARHTWATIAASLDIPKETISAALGHEIGSSTTSIYIEFDRKKIDKANRKVIDCVLGTKKKR